MRIITHGRRIKQVGCHSPTNSKVQLISNENVKDEMQLSKTK